MNFMKYLILIILILTFKFDWAQLPSDNFSGNWKTEHNRIIEIAKIGNVFNGKPRGKDIVVLSNLSFINNHWEGLLYLPQKSINVKCQAYLEGNKIRIELTGKNKRTLFWTKE